MLRVSDILDAWLQSQRIYLYIAPILTKEEFAKSVTADARKYVILSSYVLYVWNLMDVDSQI